MAWRFWKRGSNSSFQRQTLPDWHPSIATQGDFYGRLTPRWDENGRKYYGLILHKMLEVKPRPATKGQETKRRQLAEEFPEGYKGEYDPARHYGWYPASAVSPGTGSSASDRQWQPRLLKVAPPDYIKARTT